METKLRDYPVTNTTIALETGQVQLMLIEEPDWFLEQLSREDSEGKLYLPYWTYLWESSIALALHVEKLGARLKDTQVLEIGCGFGLTGIVAGQVGARVVFTDVERDALHFAERNAVQNGVRQNADFIQMDWNTPCFNYEFPYILAADVIYEEPDWTPIVTLLQNYLAPNGVAFFSEPNRSNAVGFFKLISDSGFVYQMSTCPVTLDGKTAEVAIYTVQRASIEND